MNITPKQIAMARILLDLNQKDLADRLGMARKTIMRIENGQSPGSSTTLEKIKTYFENSGLEFIKPNGVRESTNKIVKLSGQDGIRAFFDGVYETAKEKSGDICLFNGVPNLLTKWLGQDWYDSHAKRMSVFKHNFNFKIIVNEGEKNFIANEFAEYRWFPNHLFNEKTLYCHGTKLAFFDFEDDDLQIFVIDQPKFADSFRVLFNIAWDRVAIKPPTK